MMRLQDGMEGGVRWLFIFGMVAVLLAVVVGVVVGMRL